MILRTFALLLAAASLTLSLINRYYLLKKLKAARREAADKAYEAMMYRKYFNALASERERRDLEAIIDMNDRS